MERKENERKEGEKVEETVRHGKAGNTDSGGP